MIWVTIIYLILSGEISYKMYTEEEICLDMMVTYVLLPETIVESACQTFEGTRQEYIDQYIVPGGGEIQTERL